MDAATAVDSAAAKDVAGGAGLDTMLRTPREAVVTGKVGLDVIKVERLRCRWCWNDRTATDRSRIIVVLAPVLALVQALVLARGGGRRARAGVVLVLDGWTKKYWLI